MAEKVYCPYADCEVDLEKTTPEHIIPLSLGGANEFTIPVSASHNADAGSKIDGKLANDFLVLFRRKHFDARGHSNKKPIIRSKNSTIGPDKNPVQVDFSEDKIAVYDPIKRRVLDDSEISGKEISAQFKFSRNGRLKFAAKVALSGGYYAFGNWFRENVKHEDIRTFMKLADETPKDKFPNLPIKAYDEFSKPNDADKIDFETYKLFCEVVQGSCVYFVPGSSNLGIFVSVLGKFVATLNVDANTDQFRR